MWFKRYFQDAISKKQLFLLSSLSVLAVLCVGSWFYFDRNSQSILDTERESQVKTAQNNLITLEESFYRRMGLIEDTTLLLASDRDLSDLLTHFSQENHSRIHNEWMSLMAYKRIYSSFGFVDENGGERVRINFDTASQIATPARTLHYKGGGGIDTPQFDLKAGEAQATRLFLASESGQAIIPYSSRFRYYAPVVIDDSRYGNVVVTVDFEAFKSELLAPFEKTGENIELINRHGFYIYSAHQDKLFGHLVDERRGNNFSEKHPEIWANMMSKDSGVYEHAGDAYVFKRVRVPVDESPKNYTVAVTKVDDQTVLAAVLPEINQLKKNQTIGIGLIIVLSLLFGRWVAIGARLRELQRMRKAAMRSMSAITITDTMGNIEFVNDAFTRITGYSKQEVIGKNRRVMQSGEQDAGFYKTFWQCLEECGTWQGEIINKRKDGSLMTEMMSVNAIVGRKGKVTHYVASFMDITPQKRLEAELLRLSMTDPLTGCWNKRRFDQELDREIALIGRYEGSHPPFSMAMLDIDYFKKINDTFGHDIGDKALRQFAEIVRGQLREVDLLARVGGEEFAILLPNTNSSAAWLVAERIRKAVQKQAQDPAFTCSIGVSSFNSGHTKESFIKSTDLAMYQAKENGRNQVMSLLKDSSTALNRGERELSEKLDHSKKASDIRASGTRLKLI